VPQLVDDELEPEFRGLVLDDEQQLVVVGWVAQWLLGGQQPIEPQIAAVGDLLAQVGMDPTLDLAGVSWA
jgi:hypothetical protein